MKHIQLLFLTFLLLFHSGYVYADINSCTQDCPQSGIPCREKAKEDYYSFFKDCRSKAQDNYLNCINPTLYQTGEDAKTIRALNECAKKCETDYPIKINDRRECILRCGWKNK